MEVSETILVGTSIQSYSCVLLVMCPTICMGHRRSVLLGICARKWKVILATATTWLPTVLYLLCSILDHNLVAQYQYPTGYLAHTFGTLYQYSRALPKHRSSSTSMPCWHPLLSSSISIFLLCKALEKDCRCWGSINVILPPWFSLFAAAAISTLWFLTLSLINILFAALVLFKATFF